MIREGYYGHLCDDQEVRLACDAQVVAFNEVYTVVSTLYVCLALPAGIFLDKFGPAAGACVAAVCQVIGLVGVALSPGLNRSSHVDVLLISLVFMAVGGSFGIVCGYAVPFLMPERRTLAFTVTSCLFDASTIVFPILQVLHDWGVPFSILFWTYAAAAVLTFATLVVLWGQCAAAFTEIRSKGKEDVSGPSSLVASQPLREQMRSIEFVAIAVYTIVQVPRSNLFLGSHHLVTEHIAEQNGQLDAAKHIIAANSMIIPFGFLAIVAIEGCLRRFGLINTIHITTALGLTYNVLQLIPILAVQVASTVVYAAFRAFVYSVITAFMAHYFGPRTMGRVFGICFVFGGLAGLLIDPAVALSMRQDSFTVMLVIGVAVATPLPIIIHAVLMKERREAKHGQAHAEREQAHAPTGQRE